jgi:hypothetical protein
VPIRAVRQPVACTVAVTSLGLAPSYALSRAPVLVLQEIAVIVDVQPEIPGTGNETSKCRTIEFYVVFQVVGCHDTTPYDVIAFAFELKKGFRTWFDLVEKTAEGFIEFDVGALGVAMKDPSRAFGNLR